MQLLLQSCKAPKSSQGQCIILLLLVAWVINSGLSPFTNHANLDICNK